MTIKQDIANVYYDWWETGAKQHIAETEAAVTGVPIWQREISKLQPGATGELGGYTPDRPWATHYTKAGAPGTFAWRQQRAEDLARETREAKDATKRAVLAAESIRLSGKSYTRLGYQKELARLGGFSTAGAAVSALRTGTKTEADYFKEYGVSLSQQREAEARDRAAAEAAAEAKIRERETLGVPLSVGMTPFWERTYPSQVKGAIFEEQKGVQAVTSLWGKLDYEPPKTEKYYEEQIPVDPLQTQGTLLLRPPTPEEMTPEQLVQAVSDRAGTSAFIKSEGIAKRLAEKYQSELNKGKLTFEQAQGKYEREYKKETDPIKEKYYETIEKAEEKYETKVMELGLPHTFAKGLVFGGLSVIAPPFTLLAGISGVGTTAFGYSRPGGLKEQFTKRPGLTMAHIGTGVLGAGVGGWGTSFAYGKIKGFVRTIGKKPISPAELIRQSILEGEARFPTAPPKAHLKLFKAQKYKLPGEVKPGVWHATPEKFAENILVKAGKARKGEPVGLYVAPEVSPYFLRLATTNYKLFGMNFKSILTGRPGILRIYPKGIKIGIKGRLGIAELPLTKPEIQAVISPKTWLQKIGGKYYTTYKGQRIPIYQYEVLKGLRKPTGKKVTTLGKLYQKYYYKPSGVSFISPSSLAYSLGISRTYDFGVSKYYPPSKISLKKYYKPKKIYKKPILYKPSKYSFSYIAKDISKSYVPIVQIKEPYYKKEVTKGFFPPISREIKKKTPTIYKGKLKYEPKYPIEDKGGFNVYGKPIKKKGQKQKKYIKLNLLPLSKQQAQSLGSYMVDTSLSRTFKLKKTPKKPQTPRLRFPKGYFLQKRHKIRGYRIKKGRRVPLRNKFIERNPFLLDTRQEVKKITLMKRLAQMKRGARKKPIKVPSRRIIKRKPKKRSSGKRIKNNMSNYLKRLQKIF